VVYADRTAHAANQGDVFASVRFNGFAMDGMIVAHDCVCDKYVEPRRPLTPEAVAAFTISVAPVHGLDELTGDRQAHARRGEMPRYFFMPAEGDRADLVADLWLEQPVLFSLVLEQPRISSLSDEWRARLWQQFLRLRLGEDYMTFLRELVDAA